MLPKIDLAVLMLFYNFSDQWGTVNIPEARKWAKAHGLEIKDKSFTLTQEHYDLLMDEGAIADIRPMISPIVNRYKY